MGIRISLLKTALVGGAIWAANRIYKNINQLELRGKVIIVTGGSRGLGLTMARQLVKSGANVVICARNENDLKKASKQLKNSHHLAIPCDITKKEDVKNLVAEVVKKYGCIDVLINNAGTIQTGPREAMTESNFEEALKTHFWGPYYLINAIKNHMPDNGGRIVNISSIGGKISFPHLLPYNTSKFALAGYSEGITAETGGKNIKVTTVYPGLMRTGSPRNIQVKGQYEKEYAWFKIADSLPVLSINAEDAASKIISAMRRGDKTLILTLPAKLAIALHG